MLTVGLLLAACALAIRLMAGPMRRIDEEHAAAGLFGERRQDQVVEAWAGTVIDAAERLERLHHFRDHLRGRAWKGMPLRIDHGPDGWCAWHFADGEVWHVRHDDRLPRLLRRLIVEATDDRGDGLAVRTYVPGRRGIVLGVNDARPAAA